MSELAIRLTSPRQAREDIAQAYRETLLPDLRRGRHWILTLQTSDAYFRHQLRKLYHGYILRDISEQAWAWCPFANAWVRYAKPVWKRFFSEMFIPATFQEYTVRGTGEIKLRQLRLSTEALSDDAFQLFLLQVQAYATGDLGVVFEEMETYS